MDWLFDNLGKLAPIVVFLIYMISSLKGKGSEEEEVDPEAAERARRIQEEIRRKILERQRGQNGGATVQEEHPELRDEPVQEVREVSPYDLAPPPQRYQEERQPEAARSYQQPMDEFRETVSESAHANDPFLEKRREVEAKLAAAKEAKEAAQRKAASIRKKRSARVQAPQTSARGLQADLSRGLSSPRSLKASIVLKEVLDKPLGLR